VIKRAPNRLKTGLIMGRLLPAYVLVGLLKHIIPLRWLVRWAWCPPAGPRDCEAEHRSAASVLRLSQLIGLPDRDCLQRSLLLYRLLSRAGADPTLVVGFDRINGRIFGHAWIIVDGHTVIEPEAELLRFSPTFTFGSRGARLPARPDRRVA
jgi:Transglutaminase-like superfamily